MSANLREELESLGVKLDEMVKKTENELSDLDEVKIVRMKRRRGPKKTTAAQRRKARKYYRKHRREILKKQKKRRKKVKYVYKPGQLKKEDVEMLTNLPFVLDKVAAAVIPGVAEELILDNATALKDILEYIDNELLEDENINKFVAGLEKVIEVLEEEDYDDEDIEDAVQIIRSAATYLADLLEGLEEDEEIDDEDLDLDDEDLDLDDDDDLDLDDDLDEDDLDEDDWDDEDEDEDED